MTRQKRKKSKKRTSRRREIIKFVYTDDRRYRISPRILFTILLIFIGGLGSALSYAFINDTRVAIIQAREALQEQKEANAELRSELTQRYTLDEVEKIAVERLDMHKPDASQIIYISVPRQSYVILNEEDEPEAVNYAWRGIVSFVEQFIEKLGF